MKKIASTLLLWLAASVAGPVSASGCTSAIISAEASAYGRPMLWKHRDTSATDNKVEYIPGRNGEYSYVALFNASDRNNKEAWTGMNDVGFAIMNTASYNIKDDDVPERKMDREGLVMAMALKSCRTVDDFEQLLERLPRPMGVEANFGVIDASGAGAFFETNNHSFHRFNLSDAPDGILIRSNYSHSGRPDEGFGYIREKNAETLLIPYAAAGKVTPELLTETVSRSFYHSLFQKDFTTTGDRWVIDQDFIPRYKSTVTIVIEGCRPTDNVADIAPGSLSDEYIMWTGLGYPPVAEIVPVKCTPDGVDPELRGIGPDGHSPLGDRARSRRDEVFPIHRGSGDHYIDMEKLINDKGTGYLQVLVPQNLEVYAKMRRKRDSGRND